MALDYKKVEFTLHESLVQLRNSFKLLQFDVDLLDEIHECEELIKTKRYNVAVMGEFKRGKSTLINALLGSKILPADVTPTTATINRVTFAPDSKVIITYKDGTTEETGINDLSEYVTKLTTEGENRALRIKEATIYYPTQICQNYVDIIDTPGLNDEERMTKITIDMLDSVDAVIVPIHARAPFSATEKVFVCQMLESDNINNIIFVVTFMDQLDEEDYEHDSFMNSIKKRIQDEVFDELDKRSVYENIKNKAHAILDDMHLFAVSSSLALKSFITNNRKDLKQSGFDIFSTNLLHIVTAKQIENAVQKCVKNINHLVSIMPEQNEQRVKWIKLNIDNNEDAFKIISGYGNNAKQVISNMFADGYERLIENSNNLNVHKNDAVSSFIKTLSEVTSNVHDVIKNALSVAASASQTLIHSEGLLPVIETIKQYLTEDIRTFDDYRKTNLLPALNALDIKDVDSDELISKMLQSAGEALGTLTFNWTHPPIPNVPDLANCNVIETVITAVDRSVDDSISAIYNILTIIRKNWFSLAEEDAIKIKDIAESSYKQIHEKFDQKLKAQKYNYDLKLELSNSILDNCNQLLEEI